MRSMGAPRDLRYRVCPRLRSGYRDVRSGTRVQFALAKRPRLWRSNDIVTHSLSTLMVTRVLCLLALVASLVAPSVAWAQRAPAEAAPGIAWVDVAEIPPEARETLALIKAGGPFPYDKDGTRFGNRERVLPQRAADHYTEYTVKTPGARNRGARRIVTGSDGDKWYTEDHYETFRRIRE